MLAYGFLVSRIEEVTAASGQASDALKSMEKRLADMALLIKNITTCQKTKPAYDAYRKAKNKEQYRAAHEGSIILHKAAAKELKAAGVDRKLPKRRRPASGIWKAPRTAGSPVR